MRKIEKIQKDSELANGTDWIPTPMEYRVVAADRRLVKDIPDLLAEIEQLRAALSAAKELFEDECTPDERDSFVWLMQTEELLGR